MTKILALGHIEIQFTIQTTHWHRATYIHMYTLCRSRGDAARSVRYRACVRVSMRAIMTWGANMTIKIT